MENRAWRTALRGEEESSEDTLAPAAAGSGVFNPLITLLVDRVRRLVYNAVTGATVMMPIFPEDGVRDEEEIAVT